MLFNTRVLFFSILFFTQTTVNGALNPDAEDEITAEDPKRILLYAAHAGNSEEVLLSLRETLNPNFVDTNGFAALHYAAQNGHAHIIQILLDSQANPNIASDDGVTPLHFTAGLGHIYATHCLLRHTTNSCLSPVDMYGNRPFDYATQANHSEIKDMLFSHDTQRKEAKKKYRREKIAAWHQNYQDSEIAVEIDTNKKSVTFAQKNSHDNSNWLIEQ